MSENMKLRTGPIAIFLSAAIILLMALSVLIGPVPISFQSLFSLFSVKISGAPLPEALSKIDTIVFSLRLPRAILLLLTGAALGCSGASYQGLFRNPLADPFLIGVSSGAGLGAVVAQSLVARQGLSAPVLRPACARLGGILVVTVVFLLGRDSAGGAYRTNRLILAGAAMNSFCSALISFVLLYFQNNLRTSMAWMMGGITLSGWVPVRVLIPLVLIGLTGQLVSAYSLNVLQFGDDQASSLGLDAGGVQRRTIFVATLTTASAISFAGVIGFVGLIVPHVVRLLIGADYRKILPLSILGGGLFLLTADLIARRAFAPQEFPVGLITALSGAPFFFWLLSERKADRS